MIGLYQFMALLVVHWFADFVLQSNWQASNKSKSNVALAQHVITYTTAIGVAMPAIFFQMDANAALFLAINGALHFVTDWCTSRITSRLFMGQFHHPSEGMPMMKRDFSLHNFFVVVGVDQLIHQLTLAGTMVWLLGP